MTATFQKDVLTFVTLKYSGSFAPLLEIKPGFFTKQLYHWATQAFGLWRQGLTM